VKRSRLAWLAVLVGLAVVPGNPARAETTAARPEMEAWYAASPTCALPIGCGPGQGLPALPRYPAATLHVGLTAGIEDSRSYLKLGLGDVPTGARLTGGTLTIPVAGPEAGTVTPEMAQVLACFTSSEVVASEGSFATPPAVDCTTSALATFAAAPSPTFTVPLAAFAARWAEGDINNGIALVPAPGATPGASWHVAFAAGTAAATVEYETGSGESVPVEPEPSFDGDSTFEALPLGDVLTPGPPLASAAPIVDQARQPARAAPVVSVGGPGFAYPVVFALPLVLLGLGGYLGWALTRPALMSAG
jgi:hypothetical protein